MADDNQTTALDKSKAERQEMQLTADDEKLLISMLGAYRTAVSAGKYAAYGFAGFLGLIVLFNQAWDALRGLFAKIGH